jgi:uncharacterized protein
MIVTTYPNAQEFLLKAQPFLEENEAANNLLLGVCLQLKRFPHRVKTIPYFITVSAQDNLVLAAAMTPPHKLVMYGKNNPANAIEMMARQMMADQAIAPGVLGPASIAAAFARAWSDITGVKHIKGTSQRIYELRRVIPPAPVAGRLRLAASSEVDLITLWALAFQDEVLMPGDPAQTRESIELRLSQQEIYLWDNGQPVSMAARARPISRGISVNLVYTPPELRRHGYASSAVAALSQILLDEGWQFCTLFADLANPISNHIYQAIGYKLVCDVNEYIFDHVG